jgi:charged multivesicular body protein 3
VSAFASSLLTITIMNNALACLQAKNWKRQLERESRKLDRDIQNLQRAEKKAMAEAKKLAKAGQTSSARIMAREIVNTRKAVDRMYTAKAQMGSVGFALQNSIAMIKLQGVISKSNEVMVAMNQLVSLPEMQATMGSFAREMERAGMIEELVQDTMEGIGGDDIESEADKEADKIVQEIMSEVLAPAGVAPTGAPKVAMAAAAAPVEEVSAPGEDEELRAMQSRLEAL